MICEEIKLGEFPEATLAPMCFSYSKERSPRAHRAVIVCPGGGYNHLSPREAEPIAAQFLAAGFAPFILYYGVEENAANYRPLKQLALAIRYVRENAQNTALTPITFLCAAFRQADILPHPRAFYGTPPYWTTLRQVRRVKSYVPQV